MIDPVMTLIDPVWKLISNLGPTVGVIIVYIMLSAKLSNLKSSLEELKEKAGFLSVEDKELHTRVTNHEKRISYIEGLQNGGAK